MPKPVIFIIDDEPAVLDKLRADLISRYGEDYRVLTAHSGPAASDLLSHLVEAGDAVAVIVVDEDLTDTTGPEFLATLDPRLDTAKRLLVCAFDHHHNAAHEIEEAHAGAWVNKPWIAETELYPAIDDLLFDWTGSEASTDSSILLVGHRWAPHAHDLKDFLGRNRVPFRFLDLDRGRAGERALTKAGATDAELPVAILADGTVLGDPSVATLAEALGMHLHAGSEYYDVAIVGGGPAGLAAAVYGASEGLTTVLIEREAPGGQAGTSSRIENYLGFPTGVSGADLARRALTQAERFGCEILTPQEVTELTLDGAYKVLTLRDGAQVHAKVVVIATGVTYRTLPVAGLDRLAGAGVYYGAATTEALATEGEHVFVVGGANSAGQGAKYFSKFADRVTMIVRGEDLGARMSQYLVDQITETPNIEVMTGSRVVGVEGDDHLEAIMIEEVATGEVRRTPGEYLFIFVGAEPRNEWLGGLVATDDSGYILAGPDLLGPGGRLDGWPLERDPYLFETSVPGILVAGDARHGSIRRVAGGVGEGSTCIQFAHRYLAESG